MADGVELVGAQRLRASIGDARAALADMGQTHAKVARALASAASSAAPKVTGALAASITPASTSSAATVTAGIRYAGVINFGWPRRHIKANPFLTGTAERTESAWLDTYTKDVEQAIGKIEGA